MGRAKKVAPGHFVVSKPQEDEFLMVGDDLAEKQASETVEKGHAIEEKAD